MADMKEMDLYGFLHPEITPDKEIIVSSRFKTKGGDPLPFVIRPLTQDICDAIQRGCIKTDKKGNQTFDRVKYVAETTTAAECRASENLWRNRRGVSSQKDALHK